jgi:hypothetical protein
LIDQKKSDHVVAQFELLNGGHRGGAGISGHDTIPVSVLAAQIAFDGAQHFWIVIHRH